jgi:hypothetical protein
MGRDCGALRRGQGVMQECNTRESGPVDASGMAPLPHAHADERHQSTNFGFRDLAAALVALELGFGGRPRVAMA